MCGLMGLAQQVAERKGGGAAALLSGGAIGKGGPGGLIQQLMQRHDRKRASVTAGPAAVPTTILGK